MIPLDGVTGLDLSEVDAGVVDTGKVDGTLYGVCIGTSAIALVYDPAIFEKAGVAVVPGEDFGMDGHVRICFAAPEAQLVEALQRIREAL